MLQANLIRQDFQRRSDVLQRHTLPSDGSKHHTLGESDEGHHRGVPAVAIRVIAGKGHYRCPKDDSPFLARAPVAMSPGGEGGWWNTKVPSRLGHRVEWIPESINRPRTGWCPVSYVSHAFHPSFLARRYQAQ